MLQKFAIHNIKDFRHKLLHYLGGQQVFCLLDSNSYYNGKDLAAHPYYHNYDLMAGFGGTQILECGPGNAFEQLEAFQKENPGLWLMGYLGYDLKNELEKLQSAHADGLGNESLFFFAPEVILLLKGNELTIESQVSPPDMIFEGITAAQGAAETYKSYPKVVFTNRMPKAQYVETVDTLRNHIVEGDVYEVSFCQEFFAENAEIDPFDTYIRLSENSPQPFGAFLRIGDKYVLSASMERYLHKQGNKLVSQPIKGTIRRGQNADEDEALKKTLLEDEKERAENVMIVDLVRNDLSRTCKPGTVQVEELFGIYDFPGVYQMISTVTGELQPGKTGLDAIKASFPMGSMTGAPKIMAMQLIEKYEQSKRGIYAGAIGYFAPNGDFDFNVVIRTLLFNAASQYLSLHVGAAITYDSVPEKEYEECLVKIRSILKVFGGNDQ